MDGAMPVVRPVGSHAVLLDWPEPDGADLTATIASWTRVLIACRDSGTLACTEIVPGARTVLLDGLSDPASLPARLIDIGGDLAGDLGGGLGTAADGAARGEPVLIPVVYDGPDLTAVAECWGSTPERVIAVHAGTTFTVAFCGFTPGFGYLAGLPAHLAVPRRDTPRARVPAGSVALAGPWSGVYPGPSPGGWQLIGRTGVTVFDPDRDPPALLAPGTQVRFEAVAS